MTSRVNSASKDAIKLIPIPVTSGKELMLPEPRDLKVEAPEQEPSPAAAENSDAVKQWERIFSNQSKKIGRSLSAISGLSLFFSHAPAIILGLIIGFFLIAWIGGLNTGAEFLVIGLSILAAELIIHTLRRPHILGALITSLAFINWIEGLNNGAKIIVIIGAICLTDFAFHTYRRHAKSKSKFL